MKVWVDQDLCTGDGLCAEIAPAVFTLMSDGLSYVRDGGRVMAKTAGNPEGYEGRVPIPAGLDDLVLEAAGECPGECIFVGE
ncbi:MAG: ferredoxin [Actinobacteria bacterium]|nr:ferredoxin [Actinomycetota bacterium]MBU1492581.1 ferredoxin [Actinomycetota bacterium]MBU1865471.1 ferredoxin [Actinomycetota bacterium]